MYECICGKSYAHRQGRYRHKLKCPEHNKPSIEAHIIQEHTMPSIEANEIQEIKNSIDQVQLQLQKNSIDQQLQLQIQLQKQRIEELEKLSTNEKICERKRRKINEKTRQEICTKQNRQCKTCEKSFDKYFHIDHIVAIRFGGTDCIENLQALCAECHNNKSIAETKCQQKIQAAVLDILKEYQTI